MVVILAAGVTPTTVTLSAVIAFVAVLAGAISAVLGLLNQTKIKRTASTVSEISVNVDGRLSALFERQAQLLAALHENNVPIPELPAPLLLPPNIYPATAAAAEAVAPPPAPPVLPPPIPGGLPVIASDPIDGGKL